MKISATHHDFIRAIVSGDTRTADELNERIPQTERRDFHVFVSAFFALMLEQRFKDDSSRETISTFVDEMRHDFRNANPPMQPLVVEALIRAHCGEDHLFEELSATDVYRAEFQVIVKVGTQTPEVRERLGDFLADAERLAQSWSAEAEESA
ncbi:hypothetical protein LX16_5187 [Stackebrandtia albiflava]|uniref:Uncharacterized protein n=1 Tax=Stackebrandtia albiflava TaxID=406432 RepID=A0A562ULF1_9ACTN|nr:hypothetical protein [Stackebrandtia albiflava]TWJ06451.1 hypothetical protein LX16_5187 [Stackebrandtia albiflava]